MRPRGYEVLLCLVGFSIALVLYMIWRAGAAPIQRDLTVELHGLPPATAPLKIALLSDFHVAKVGDTPERLRDTVRRVNGLNPDVVLLAGDFDGDSALGRFGMRPIASELVRLKARLGVFAVLGNHDYPGADRRMLWLNRAGIQTLDNAAARAGPLVIVGISDAFSHHDRASAALDAAGREGGVPVVLTHSPDVIPALPANIELALAGHTHCGQVVLPLIGALETRSRYGQRYACGIVREGRRTTVITSGLGVSRLPFRLGASPDFWVITIVPGSK